MERDGWGAEAVRVIDIPAVRAIISALGHPLVTGPFYRQCLPTAAPSFLSWVAEWGSSLASFLLIFEVWVAGGGGGRNAENWPCT